MAADTVHIKIAMKDIIIIFVFNLLVFSTGNTLHIKIVPTIVLINMEIH